MAETVGAILIRRGKLLLGLRASHKTFAGDWDLIGGHVEEGESEWAALCRELKEEIGIEDPVGVRLRTLTIDTPWLVEVVHVYLVDCWRGEPSIQNVEHIELGWFNPSAAAAIHNLVTPDYRAMFLSLQQ